VKTPTKPISNLNANAFSSEKKEDGIKVCRGPFNVNCTTCKEPKDIMFEMIKALEIYKVTLKKVNTSVNIVDGAFRTEMSEEQCEIRP